jgi:hypothetical protein
MPAQLLSGPVPIDKEYETRADEFQVGPALRLVSRSKPADDQLECGAA